MSPKLDKDRMETICRNAGLVPEKREAMQGHEVFIADGYSSIPHITFKRFGVEPEEFPYGCFATLWWIARGDEELDVGMPLIFDAFHNPEYDPETKKKGRVNRAMQDAAAFLRTRKEIRLNG